jgi:hypothetical protein
MIYVFHRKTCVGVEKLCTCKICTRTGQIDAVPQVYYEFLD